jgi:lipoprotein-releasing system permease protein
MRLRKMLSEWKILFRIFTFPLLPQTRSDKIYNAFRLKLPLLIALRYLFSRRKKNFINVISGISVVAVTIITAAIIIVLSVFNGLESLLHSLNNSFDPEIRIESAKGKSFLSSDSLIKKIEGVAGVAITTQVIEDYALVRYRDSNQIVTLKGVSENFVDQNRIPAESIVDGEFKLKKKGVSYAIVGRGIQNTLSIAPDDPMYTLQIYYIKNMKGLDPSQMYTRKNILPGGVFSIMQTFDENYIIVPLDFSQDLLDYGDKRTSIEIKTVQGSNPLTVQASLRSLLGESFNVLNQEEQHKDLYRLLKMEKLFTFLALSLLLAIGSINIFFSLMMLALDKKKDISVLSAMGADDRLVRNIFLIEGGLIAMIGTVSGLVLGGLFCWAQGKFGFISMGMETSVAQGYPIHMVWTDFVFTLLTVSVITGLIALRPASLAAKSVSIQHL